MDKNLESTKWKLLSHKVYKIDAEKVRDIEDFGTILRALADQFTFTEGYKHFDKIKHLLREE